MTSRRNSFVLLFTLAKELRGVRQTQKNGENHTFKSLAVTAMFSTMFSTRNSLPWLTERPLPQAEVMTALNMLEEVAAKVQRVFGKARHDRTVFEEN